MNTSISLEAPVVTGPVNVATSENRVVVRPLGAVLSADSQVQMVLDVNLSVVAVAPECGWAVKVAGTLTELAAHRSVWQLVTTGDVDLVADAELGVRFDTAQRISARGLARSIHAGLLRAGDPGIDLDLIGSNAPTDVKMFAARLATLPAWARAMVLSYLYAENPDQLDKVLSAQRPAA